MAKFCGKCGSKLDETTGLCPNCQANAIQEESKKVEPKEENPKKKKEEKLKADRRTAKKEREAHEIAEKKVKKKNDWAKLTLSQKVRIVITRLLVWMLMLSVLITVSLGVLTYYGVVNIPFISSVISEIFLTKSDDIGGVLYTPDENAIAIDEETGIVYVNNVVIIFFNKESSEKEINNAISSINGEVVGCIPAIDQYQVKIANKTLDELVLICEKLKQNDCVFDAIYDVAFELDADAIPNDPWGKKWYTKKETWSESNPDGANWWVEAIDAPSAWEYDKQYKKIKIGIVDNGFDDRHEDLKNVITYTSPINNKEVHGTHVAGIIGAKANNGKGITGLVWNSEIYTYDWQLNVTQSVANHIFDMQWSTFNQILGGTVLLVEKGAKVVNLSAGQSKSMKGTTRTNSDVNYNGYYASLYLYSLLERDYDFVIVQSAGNGNYYDVSVDAKYNGLYCSITEENCVTGEDVRYEDIVGRIVIVGAAQNDGNNRYSQTHWSNAGSRVDICAPGKDIYSTIPGGLFGSYEYLSGTSMAAPIVAGVSSLVWSVNPELSGAEVKNIVCDSKNAENVVADNDSEKHPLTNTYCLVNAKLAVEAAMRYSSEESVPSPPGSEDKEELVPDRVTSDERDVVLVLDVSGSMDGRPMEETIKASENFIDTVLQQDASIGIVTYESYANQTSDFSIDGKYLKQCVRNIYASGGTNIDSGISMAHDMLKNSNAKKKIIVLMSDGEPNEGREGQALIDYADEVKKDGITIYTLGFFENLGSYKTSAQMLMEGIASEGCHYEVANADDLVFFFEDMADQINGTKYIYIRIACPVEVSVTFNGETLSSADDSLNQRTEFGTLTFEESENPYGGENDRVKILRLKEGEDYDVQIVGTGRGLMDYTIGFMDEDGEYSDIREFHDVKINKHTVIDTVASTSRSTVLKVDQDGDGDYDVTYRAKENSIAEEDNASTVIWVVVAAVIVVAAAAVAVLIVIKKRKRGKIDG